VVNVNPTSKYKEYNDAVAGPEAGGKYSTVNDKETKIIDGKKVTTIKPVDDWAIGRYQHYFVHAKAKIMDALAAEGINTNGLSKEAIAKAYRDSPKAQERVQELINENNFAQADKQIKKYGLKAPTQEIVFLNHFLGNSGADHYLTLLKKHGYKKADEIMAYGNDPDRPEYKGIGGPDSGKANAFVSKHMMTFRESYGKVTQSNKPSTTYTSTSTANKSKLPPITNFPIGGGKFNIGYDTKWNDWNTPNHNSDFSKKATNAGVGGHKSGHFGVDIFGPKGAPILSPVNGKVTYDNGNGLTVIIVDPETGYSHWLGHLDKRTVPEGTVVVAGQQVGELGNTGNAKTTAPHLHYNVYNTKGGYYTGEDPLEILVSAINKK
jgi:murein DD-endopeptidase MepM/ murein hydrolase activator NlpD